MTHTAYTHMKPCQGHTGAADPVLSFRISFAAMTTDEYFSVGVLVRLFLQSSDIAIISIISCKRPRPLCTNALYAVTNALILARKPHMRPDTHLYSQPRATV